MVNILDNGMLHNYRSVLIPLSTFRALKLNAVDTCSSHTSTDREAQQLPSATSSQTAPRTLRTLNTERHALARALRCSPRLQLRTTSTRQAESITTTESLRSLQLIDGR